MVTSILDGMIKFGDASEQFQAIWGPRISLEGGEKISLGHEKDGM
jgi:hypothetical protein